MGMGKTVSTLTAINELMFSQFKVHKVLIIAPLRVAKTTWVDELKKWDHLTNLKHSVVIGTPKVRMAALAADADVYLINRENIPWLVKQYGAYKDIERGWGFKLNKEWKFDMLVIDESSSFKNPKAKRFKMIKHILPKTNRVVELTGTPSPNGLLDLWAQLYILDSGKRLGHSMAEYKRKYFTVTSTVFKMGRVIDTGFSPKKGAEAAIYKKIEDICVSMKSVEYLKMPTKVIMYHEVDLNKKARDDYNKMEKDLLLEISESGDDDVVAGSASVLANKLLQMSNGAVYTETGGVHTIHEAKIDKLEDLIESANGRPVLVFYNYKHDLSRIQARIPKAEVLDSEESIERWNNREIPVLLAHPASAGHGLNLQRGSNFIIWFGLTWSLELYEQANARLYRQGQPHDRVVINHIVTKNTYDSNVIKSIDGKASVQNRLLESVKARMEEVL